MIRLLTGFMTLSGAVLWIGIGIAVVDEYLPVWRAELRRRWHNRKVNRAMGQAKVLMEAMARVREIERP